MDIVFNCPNCEQELAVDDVPVADGEEIDEESGDKEGDA